MQLHRRINQGNEESVTMVTTVEVKEIIIAYIRWVGII
jgi:hypothetical protein